MTKLFWRTDGRGNWYAVDRASSSGGLGVPVTDIVACSCGRTLSPPGHHADGCNVLAQYEAAEAAARAAESEGR